MKLNIGCGDKKLDGYVNVDISEKCTPDVVWDVTETPYTWAKEGEVERIECDNLMEHLSRDQVIKVMNEFNRLLRPGGTVWIKSPVIPKDFTYSHLDGVFGDPTHRSYFTERTFDYWSMTDRMHRWQLFGKDYGILPFSSLRKEYKNPQMVWELTK